LSRRRRYSHNPQKHEKSAVGIGLSRPYDRNIVITEFGGSNMKLKVISSLALLALFAVAGGAIRARAQSVQTWTVTQGVCGDWRGTWAMQHAGPGHWIGTSIIKVVGQQCTGRPIGTQITANVDFQTNSDLSWTASTTNTNNADDCRYSGTVNENTAATGTYRCGGSNGQLSNISIVSPTAFYNKD